MALRRREADVALEWLEAGDPDEDEDDDEEEVECDSLPMCVRFGLGESC